MPTIKTYKSIETETVKATISKDEHDNRPILLRKEGVWRTVEETRALLRDLTDVLKAIDEETI